MSELCNYCGEQPIALQFNHTCESCVYTCAGCGLITPYESGAADDMPDHCDTCWANAHRNKED